MSSMVHRRVRKLLLCLGVATACGGNADSLGGETNWLKSCTEGSPCELGTCHCGVCTTICDTEAACAGLPNALCAPAQSTGFARQCGAETLSGVCLPRCTSDTGCASGQACVDGGCVLASSNNPTGTCVARDNGARFGVHSPEATDVYLPDCQNPLSREYWRVFSQTSGTAYMIPIPAASPFSFDACRDSSDPLYAVLTKYGLCAPVSDPTIANAMVPTEALTVAHSLHGKLVFTQGTSDVDPGALANDVLDACNADAALRTGPLKNRCDFEIAAAQNGVRGEMGWTHTGAEGQALATALNQLYGMAGTELCGRLEQRARIELDRRLVALDHACAVDADCIAVSRGSSCHDACGAVVSASASTDVDAARGEVDAGICSLSAAANCPAVEIPPCLEPQARCLGGVCQQG